MKSYPDWQYNEMKQVGTDYNDPAQVEVYDSQMGMLRDIKKENEDIIKTLDLTNNQTLIEFGTGTGNFAIDAARNCKKVYAIDVSPHMLEFVQKKAESKGILNIEFHNAGFLTYEHSEAPVDAVVSQLALHHLPDFWKLIALKRVFGMLKNGGKFFLKDTVYSFDENTYEAFFNNLINIIRKAGGTQIANDLEIGIRDEYSTPGWIMEALLLRAGFTINEKQYSEGFIAVYLCTKECTKECTKGGMNLPECKSIEEVRENINRIDREMVELISQRSRYVAQAAKFKKTTQDVKAPSRVEEVISKVRSIAVEHDLDPDIVEKIYRTMIACFIDYEMKIHKR